MWTTALQLTPDHASSLLGTSQPSQAQEPEDISAPWLGGGHLKRDITKEKHKNSEKKKVTLGVIEKDIFVQ